MKKGLIFISWMAVALLVASCASRKDFVLSLIHI